MRAIGLAVLCLTAGLVAGTWADDPSERSGKILETRGGGDKAKVAGGAVIVDSHGNRLELIPPRRPASAAQTHKDAAAPLKLTPPTFDDPSAGLETRKHRAAAVLLGSVLAAYALVVWARRRWRPPV